MHNRSCTVAGGVVVIVLVQIKSLEKALAKAQKELARVLTANKGLKEKAGRLEKANRVLEAEGQAASKQLLRLEEELAQLKQEAPMQPAAKCSHQCSSTNAASHQCSHQCSSTNAAATNAAAGSATAAAPAAARAGTAEQQPPQMQQPQQAATNEASTKQPAMQQQHSSQHQCSSNMQQQEGASAEAAA